MKVIETKIPGVLIVETDVFGDLPWILYRNLFKT